MSTNKPAKRGPRPGPEGSQRTERLVVRMTPDERNAAPEIAEKEGFSSASAYVRWLLFGVDE